MCPLVPSRSCGVAVELIKTKLSGVVLLQPKVFGDHRGFFMESYTKSKLSDLGLDLEFVQDNHSLSEKAGTIRGLHYQTSPMATTKLVRALRGAILDVVVDIRTGSPTFSHWYSTIISAENKRQILVPKGFAHGMCTLVENTEIAYKVDQYYSPDHDEGFAWDDPEVGIEWPTSSPILSEKDKMQPRLKDANNNFNYEELQKT
jgi:dTDP-4-dehydrorhamnose 3,5-epimerase